SGRGHDIPSTIAAGAIMNTDRAALSSQLSAIIEPLKAESRQLTALAILVLLFVSPACARAHAKTTPDMTPLEMPAPPSRDLEPDPETAPEPVRTAGRGARPAPTAGREPARTDAPRPEPPPTEP